jgi:hypothetical protein
VLTTPRAVAGRHAAVVVGFLAVVAAVAACTPNTAHLTLTASAQMRMQTFLTNDLKWPTWNIYEFNDEQSLDTDGNYGPLAMVFANPGLGSFSQNDYADTGIIAAVVFIDPAQTDLPDSYREDLGLYPDFTCIVMQWQANKWIAYSVKSDDRTCRTTTGTRFPLNVREVYSSTDPKDYPPVTRFQITRKRHNIIGVRCLRADAPTAPSWCELGTQAGDAVEDPEYYTDPAIPSNVQAKIPAWHDYQRVGHKKWSADWEWPPIAERIKPVMKGTVIPLTGIGDLDSLQFKTDTGLVVAYVYIGDKSWKKYDGMGIKRGWTALRLRLNPASGRWGARYVSLATRTASKWYHVERKDHHAHFPPGVRMPGTARWRWDDKDEEIWVVCDIGCCRVTSGDE